MVKNEGSSQVTLIFFQNHWRLQLICYPLWMTNCNKQNLSTSNFSHSYGYCQQKFYCCAYDIKYS